MKNWKHVVFLCSLILNLGLIIGFVGFRHYVRVTTFQLIATTAQAEVNLLESILSDLESDDPEKTAALEERLRLFKEKRKKTSDIWEQAAKK